LGSVDTDPNLARGSKLNSIVEVVMTNTLMQRLLATVLLTLSMQTAFAGGSLGEDLAESALFRYPATTSGTVDSANLISRVERALLTYAAGCATRDQKALAEVFTDFAVIAYASNIPGRFIASDAITADRCWAASALTVTFPSESPIWIYPTSDPNDVMVQYTAVVGTGTAQHAVQDIALVEMAGDRIAEIRDYASRADLEP
jgi:hypothetical protein